MKDLTDAEVVRILDAATSKRPEGSKTERLARALISAREELARLKVPSTPEPSRADLVWAASYAVHFQVALQRPGGSRINARAIATEQADRAAKEIES